jgi:hypothetical protein
MKYFTPDRYHALQQTDEAAMLAADADWESAIDQYEAYLETVRPEMPEPVRLLLDGYYLHDANVLSMGRRGDQLCISLQLDVPPNDLLFITYTLAGSPEINTEAFPTDAPKHNPQWLYEEIEQVRASQGTYFVHAVLFSNGWEVRLPFHDVMLTTASPLFPPPHSQKAATAAAIR